MKDIEKNKNYKQERLVKILADSTNNRVYVSILVIGFFILLSLYFIAAFAVPHTFINFEGVTDCPDSLNFKGYCHYIDFKKTDSWTVHLGHLTKKNQFLLIFGKIMPVTSTEMEFDLKYKIDIKPVNEYGDEKEDSKKMDLVKKENTARVNCEEGETYCKMNEFILYPQITHDIYRISIKIDVTTFDRNDIKGIYFNARTISEKYTNFTLALRYTFFCISIISSILYLIFYFKLSNDLKTFEHRFISILSFLIPFFNNPFYAINIFSPSVFMAILSTYFTVSLISILLLFWIIMVQRIWKEKIRVKTKLINPLNLILWFVGFVFLMVTSTIGAVVFRFDPAFHVDREYPTSYQVFEVFVLIYMLVLLILLFFCIYKMCGQWKKIIWRHKIFFIMSIYFFLAVFILSVTGAYQSYDSDGIKVLMMIFIVNFYIILLQIFWRFTKDGIKDYKEHMSRKKFFKKNTEERKKEYGLDYFDNNYDVKISRKVSGDERKEQIPLNQIQKDKFNVLINSKGNTNNLEDKNKFMSIQKKFDEDESHSSEDDSVKNTENTSEESEEEQSQKTSQDEIVEKPKHKEEEKKQEMKKSEYQKFDEEINYEDSDQKDDSDENIKSIEDKKSFQEIKEEPVKDEDLLKFTTINAKNDPIKNIKKEE